MPITEVTIDDKYALVQGRVYISGVQALIRLAIAQSQRDRASGLKTAGFISGYRGSPLGTFDKALEQAQPHLRLHSLHFQPGLNEDIAATSIWGTQQVGLSPDALVDGVFSIWYGKGPGVDRSLDALKHGNFAGAAPHGGVLVVAGDDHNCRSSTLPHQSEQALQAAMIPILNPASLQDYIDFGLYGLALSRFSGCWIGFKAISETVESSAIVAVAADRPAIVTPEFEMPPGGLNIRWPDPPLEQEARLNGPRMAAVGAFVHANGIDRLVIDSPRARFGIITTGKAYFDVKQALAILGIDDQHAAATGIRLYKVGLSWPLERIRARAFADGLRDVLVVEEKRAFIEPQLIDILYNLDASRRPSVVGKRDEHGAPLLSSDFELTPLEVARAIASRLVQLGESDIRLPLYLQGAGLSPQTTPPSLLPERTPFFCAGCPHNTSTNVPQGSRALAGIGCHGMAMLIPERRTAMGTHMGGEGALWIGQSPFTAEKHVFQNLGDGTYQHSGSLALRAAAVAGVNITYKILYNDAVGMTGGQPVEGRPSVAAIAREVIAEGAKAVAVVTDEPRKYRTRDLPPEVPVYPRGKLDSVQKQLREIPGLTVLIYDQTCAAEMHRRRKRGLAPEAERHVFINEAVCEDCGDCVRASNCIAIGSVETEFGRKRAINQSSCNDDYSCLKGFCPSFVTVRGGSKRRRLAQSAATSTVALADIPPPPTARMRNGAFSILVTGIGGTGIITVGALIGMAAHLEDADCTILDVTGVAQKNGAVMSHVRVSSAPEQTQPVRIGANEADLILGCDLVVATSAQALECIDRGRTRAIVNGAIQATAQSVLDPNLRVEAGPFKDALSSAGKPDAVEFIEATGAATALLGDGIFANVLLLGYACQRGLVPVSSVAIERALELNGVDIAANKRAFQLGRLAAHDRGRFDGLIEITDRRKSLSAGFDAMVAQRENYLSSYQNLEYARRYRAIVERALNSEQRLAKSVGMFSRAVAQNLFKLMAYKDEYEVARLHTDGRLYRQIDNEIEGRFKIEMHLAIPLISGRDPQTGHWRRRRYGSWMLGVLSLLAKLKRLRGTRFDPFGYSIERRTERQLIRDYERIIAELAAGLNADNYALAVEIAAIPTEICGFGHIKLTNVECARRREADLIRQFRAPAKAPSSLSELVAAMV